MNQEEAGEHFISTLYPSTLNLYTVHLPGELVHCTPGESTANPVSRLELVHCESTANLSSSLADLEDVLSASAMLYPTFCSRSKQFPPLYKTIVNSDALHGSCLEVRVTFIWNTLFRHSELSGFKKSKFRPL